MRMFDEPYEPPEKERELHTICIDDPERDERERRDDIIAEIRRLIDRL